MPCELPRRTLLVSGGALLAALLTGCSGDAPETADENERSPAAQRLRRTAEGDSAVLLARYDAALNTHPELAEGLTPLRGSVAAHLSVLRKESGADDPSVDRTPATEGAAPEPPTDARSAARDLAAAESRLAEARLRALGDAPPELARLLASLAAAGTAHAHLLQEVSP